MHDVITYIFSMEISWRKIWISEVQHTLISTCVQRVLPKIPWILNMPVRQFWPKKCVLGWIKHWASNIIHDNANSIQMLPDRIFNHPLHTVLPKRTSLLLANSANKYYYLGKWSSDTHSPTRDIHIECSKQFKWNSYFYVSGQSRPFWAALKLL